MKKMLCLCLILMLYSSACASPLPVTYYGAGESGSYSMLLSQDGTPLTPRDTYGYMYPLLTQTDDNSPTLYAVTPTILESSDPESYEYPYRYALMSEDGQLLTDFDYLTFEHLPDDDLIRFADLDNRYGIMNEQGEIVVKPDYICIYPNGRGGYLAQPWPKDGIVNYESTYPIVYIDEKGRSFDTGINAAPHGLYAFKEGFFTVFLNYNGGNDRCVFLDFEGTNLFQKAYGWSDGFYGNYASVMDGNTGLYGLIDLSGAWALPAEYISIDCGSYYDTGTFLVCGENHAQLLDAYTLEPLAHIDYDSRDINYAWISGKYFISASGEYESHIFNAQGELLFSYPLINAWYSYSDSMPERFVVTEGDWPNQKSYLVNLSGQKIDRDFQELYPATWSEGQGRYTFSTYGLTESPEGEQWPDYASCRYGLCDQDGNILLEAKYSSFEVLSPNRYWVRLGTRCGMIDDTGKWYYAIDDYEYLMD